MSLCYTIKEILPDKNYDIDVIQQDVIDKFNEMHGTRIPGAGISGAGISGAGISGAGISGAGISGAEAQELESQFFAQKLEYSLNYKVKELSAILDYYNLPKRKMCKEGMINAIIEYENKIENSEIVHTRKRLWKYAKELKEDKYFSKILLFDF